MTTLLIADVVGSTLATDITAKALAAAQALGAPIHVLVAGEGVGSAAEAAAALPGVEKVLVADGDQALRFRHALLREAVYDDLLPGERGELHHALAVHLEHELAADDLERGAQVAAHYAAAGDQRAALRTTVVAAEAASTDEFL